LPHNKKYHIIFSIVYQKDCGRYKIKDIDFINGGDNMAENPILEGQIDAECEVPLYYQLISIIKRNINGNVLKPGDSIPSEVQICDRYQVSRSTVRQALKALEDEGLIFRRRGKGTFIAEQKVQRKLNNLYNFSSDMRHLGYIPKSRIISFEKIKPKTDLINTLQLLNVNTEVFKIVRVRIANDVPLLLETTYIPVYLCPYLEESVVEQGSLYEFLKENASLVPYNATETFEPIIFDKQVAEILECNTKMCGYFVERISYLQDGQAFELTQSVVRGDKCRYEVELYQDSVNFRRTFNKKSLV
jgi:GntR family transcriptional regulator